MYLKKKQLNNFFKKRFFFFIIFFFLLGFYFGNQNFWKKTLLADHIKDFYWSLKKPDKLINGKTYKIRSTLHKKKHSENFIIEEIDKDVLKSIETNWSSRNSFQEFIKNSLGTDNLPKGIPNEFSTALEENSKNYHNGSISYNSIDFNYPEISVRYLHAKHHEKKKKLVIVLHGHGSSANKVMGLDKKDYMNEIGKRIFEEGYDVISFDTTSNMRIGGYLNSQLLLYGIQIYGLWTKAIMDLAESKEIINDYEDIYLYGFSNGALIANFCSILDGNFSKIIIDDIVLSKIKGNFYYHREQEYQLYFLRPLWAKINLNDFVKFSKKGTFFISNDLFNFNKKSIPGISIIPKKYLFHVPEEDKIISIFKK